MELTPLEIMVILMRVETAAERRRFLLLGYIGGTAMLSGLLLGIVAAMNRWNPLFVIGVVICVASFVTLCVREFRFNGAVARSIDAHAENFALCIRVAVQSNPQLQGNIKDVIRVLTRRGRARRPS
jgi:MFS family permease